MPENAPSDPEMPPGLPAGSVAEGFAGLPQACFRIKIASSQR
jgi:hypothetical protein